VLTDSDVRGRVKLLEAMQKIGVKLFFVYPHAARPSMINDHYPTWEGTTAQFVVNEHHAEVLRTYGYEKPLHSIGWHLCPLHEFRPKDRAQNVLFAPIHPRNAPQDKKVNLETFERLYGCVKKNGINLTIRHMGDLVDNGIPKREDVKYVQGKMDQSFREIDDADIVIGHQTVAWIAVARGVPTVMIRESMPTHFRASNQGYEDVKSWDRVSHLFRYPLDILEESDTMGLLNRAIKSDDEIWDWRRRMIGDAFSPEVFVKIIEEYL